MDRKFMIEYRNDGPIATAVWLTVYPSATYFTVVKDCKDFERSYKCRLRRITELVPVAPVFTLTVELQKID